MKEVDKNKEQKSKNTKDSAGKMSNQKKMIIGLSIATGILGASTIGLGVAYGITQGQAMGYSNQLENIYKKNYYEVVESVNSADMNISKVLASNEQSYQAKMLAELAQTAKEIQANIASLPLSSDSVAQIVRFINQMSGYTQTLEKKVSEGGTLSENDLDTLKAMHDSLTDMKRYLNRMSDRMIKNYSIMKSSSRMSDGIDEFSTDFGQVKASDADFPTMIYDGPFADSIVNQKVKGLTGNEVSKEEAYKAVDSMFKNISNIKYSGQTNGKFSTYDFVVLNSDNQKVFVQVTKIGGNILTVSGNVMTETKNISFEQAEKIALDFAKENGVEDATVVWSDELQSQAYFNVAPKQSGIILYPDLVQIKVDMSNSNVIGYVSVPYWTNHTTRNLEKAGASIDTAREHIDSSFTIKNERLVLAPLDYGREVLCYEFECERNGSTYYIYINAVTNIEENILKVVKTSDGSKLM